MVEKTKRAISILQNRGVEPHSSTSAAHQEAPLADIKRQTEEKIAEFRRNAEDAVNQVSGREGRRFLNKMSNKINLSKKR
jgi:CBFA2/RNUX1 translocation partner 1